MLYCWVFNGPNDLGNQVDWTLKIAHRPRTIQHMRIERFKWKRIEPKKRVCDANSPKCPQRRPLRGKSIKNFVRKNKTSAMETLRRDLSDPWWESWNREKFNFGTTQKWVKKSLLRKLCEVPTKVVTSEEWSKQGRTQKEDRKPLQKDQANKSVGRMPWHQEPTKDVISCEKLRGGANIHRSADIRMGEPNWANLSYPQMNT